MSTSLFWFLDYLTIKQDHGYSLPVVSSEFEFVSNRLPVVGQFRKSLIEIDTGVQCTNGVTSKQLRGSAKSSVMVRCDGSNVEVSGNPSKWGRVDNVFGIGSIQKAVAVFNAILLQLGLPPFTKATWVKESIVNDKSTILTNGAIITRIDMTTNHSTGDPQKNIPALRALSTHVMGHRFGYLYPNQRTVDWRYEVSDKGSRFLYSKIYDKAYEMLQHRNLQRHLSESEIVYLNKIIKWVTESGLLREEHTLKSKFLRRHGAYIYGTFSDERLIELVGKARGEKFMSTANVNDYSNIALTLVAKGVCKKPIANKLQGVVYQWLAGENIEFQYVDSRSTFYKHRAILQSCGIDIKQKFDIQRHLPKIQVVELKPLQIPEWYQMPDKAILKLVA